MNQPIVQVRALVPELLPDFLKFFDGTAFSDNPKWSSCYCQCFYEAHRVVQWSERTAPENRARACERIDGGLIQGYLAYSDGSPVGWCNAAPRTLLHALDDQPIPDAEQIGAIICFLVEPNHRGRGVARQLLEAACNFAESAAQPGGRADVPGEALRSCPCGCGGTPLTLRRAPRS